VEEAEDIEVCVFGVDEMEFRSFVILRFRWGDVGRIPQKRKAVEIHVIKFVFVLFELPRLNSARCFGLPVQRWREAVVLTRIYGILDAYDSSNPILKLKTPG
jgi:hypothetical protein